MKPSTAWESELQSVLAHAQARASRRLTLADPWQRALTCCVVAQRIRAGRIRQAAARPLCSNQERQMDWEAALAIAAQEARQRIMRRRMKGGWDYALKLKLSGQRLRTQASASGKPFVLAK